MCILFVAINQHPKFPLIVCANRDEFYQRPTLPAHKWSQEENAILAGKDRQAGGSWLGINPQGFFCAVTNFRKGKSDKKYQKSRGELVTTFLTERYQKINEFQQFLADNSDTYGPFNLVYGNLDRLYCYSSENKRNQVLCDGFHSISNGFIDEYWPKMSSGVNQLQELIIDSWDVDHKERMLSLLRDDTQASDDNLPKTGVSDQWEKLLSSIFIATENYGTRASTVLLQSITGEITFIEQTYQQLGIQGNQIEIILEKELLG